METTQTRTQTRTTRASDEALRLAIDPVAPKTFLAEHWERQPLHVARREPRRFDHLLAGRDLERLLCSSAIREPAFRLVRAGENSAIPDYTVDIPWRPRPFSGAADVPRVLTEVEAGATLVLQGLHFSWQPLAEYCRGLEARLQHRVQANAYFTPRATQGLPVHHDTHDVFVLQVEGTKRWLVYEPVLELPLSSQRYRRELGEPGEAALDLTLHAGDTLYLPRGWLHEAVASQDDSLHLTVGVNVYTWLDAFSAALAECGDELEFRRAVADGEAPELLARLAARLDPDQISARRRRKLARARRPILDGQLSQLRGLESLSGDALVERRPTTIAELEIGNGRLVLGFDGKEIRFPLHAAPAVEHLFDAESPVRVDDLPGSLDEPGRLVLVSRLVREGFLWIRPSPDGPPRQTEAGAAK